MTHPFVSITAAAAMVGWAAGCAHVGEPVGTPRKETLHALTARMELLTINAGQPQRVTQKVTVTGLAAGETLVGIDYRVAKGVLFALSSAGRLYTLDSSTGALTAVGANAALPTLSGTTFGMDFNPVADRIRVVSDSGQNLRLHPDTGALVATDPALSYAPGDAQAGRTPRLAAAAYTYNKKDDKLTTNYAIDRSEGTLVVQGSVEGSLPVESPNTGVLKTVGALGTGPLTDATFDIADTTGAAFIAVRSAKQPHTRLYLVNLASGQSERLGTVGDGSPLVGLSFIP